jgi:hypothetical protein
VHQFFSEAFRLLIACFKGLSECFVGMLLRSKEGASPAHRQRQASEARRQNFSKMEYLDY